jgi:hypothetical protein
LICKHGARKKKEDGPHVNYAMPHISRAGG